MRWGECGSGGWVGVGWVGVGLAGRGADDGGGKIDVE